ncbi:MAG: MATE family efflux transporter, partial [Chloroflexi bacterium]|nr:MATE family efflux transporter [Chloroflexota bacterium]
MATIGRGAAGAGAARAEAAGVDATGIKRREISRPAHVDLDAETDRQLQRAVWALAWPSVLTMMLQVGNSFLDRFFVGSLGPDALAAVGVGSQVMFLLFSVGMSISIGTTALVSRFAGANEISDARTAANQSVWIGVFAAFICMALMMPARVSIVGLLGVDQHASILCSRYLAITILGVPALFMMLILSSVFRGLGDTVRPLVVMIGVNLIHLSGDYLLIFGHYGFPRLGLMGGALALLTSQVIGASLYVLFLRRSVVAGFLRCQSRLHLDWSRRILRIGFPAALQNASRNLSMLTFTAVLA